MSKFRDEYPTTVTLAYNLMLEWQTEPSSIQGGTIKRNNNLVFVQHNKQGDSERTAKIYKNIKCYKCGQLDLYSRACPFKEDKQENLKDKGSSPDKIVQGINHATAGISSMHVDHKSCKSNRET